VKFTSIDHNMVLAAGGLALLACGIFLGKMWARRAWRRLALRHNDGNGTPRMAIVPKDDGSMELYLPNPALKALRRGEKLEAVVQGSKSQMIFRVVSDEGRLHGV
jgi:hypothetical protein